jgi:N-acetylmuramoyl-L-alanine amidase
MLALMVAVGGPDPVAAATDPSALPGGQQLDPSAFSPGACVAYQPAPTANQHETVFLDAGHGGVDPGAVGETEFGQTVLEADETLPVELDAATLLVSAGYRVVVSRTAATSVVRLNAQDVSAGELTVQGAHDDVAARDVCANLARADVLVGIYFDAGASTLDAGSLTAYDAARPFAADNLKLATLVQFDVLATLDVQGWDIPDDGVAADSSLGGPPLSAAAAAYGHLLLLGPADPGFFSTPSDMPGALIEPLFVTDPFEATIAASTAGQEAIAAGIALAVEQYLRPEKAERLRPTAHGTRRPR